MKKLIICFMAVLFSGALMAQNENRVEIKGKVNVSIEEDASGINIYNTNTGRYTFTDDYGQFKINVKEGDELVFSSVQYQQFTLKIGASVIMDKKLSINLSTKTNLLDEVVIKRGLSGEIDVDVKKLKTQQVDLPTSLNANDLIYGYDYELAEDYLTTPENDAIDKGYLQNGINFVGIFKGVMTLFGKERSADDRPVDMDVQIRKLYNNDFFRKYMDIKEEEINDFIFFMEERGLTYEKMKSYNDLELIQHILKESREFKKQDGQ